MKANQPVQWTSRAGAFLKVCLKLKFIVFYKFSGSPGCSLTGGVMAPSYYNMKRIISIVCCIGWIGLGVFVLSKGYFFYFGDYFDQGGSKYIVGMAMILFGILGLWISLKIRTSDLYEEGTYLKCIDCLSLHDFYSYKNKKCPQCNGNLEELDGFYKRHPELK